MVAVSNAEGLCDAETMLLAPESVLAPCTTIINDSSRTTGERSLAIYIRGATQRSAGELELAFADLSAGLELDEKNSLIHQDIARVYWDRGDYEKAYEHVYRALEINPNGRMENHRLAMFLFEAGAPEAIDQLNRLVEINPESVEGRYRRVLFHINNKKFEPPDTIS